jgi:hypothetical protein
MNSTTPESFRRGRGGPIVDCVGERAHAARRCLGSRQGDISVDKGERERGSGEEREKQKEKEEEEKNKFN